MGEVAHKDVPGQPAETLYLGDLNKKPPEGKKSVPFKKFQLK